LRHEEGEFAEVRFELRSTARSIELRAQRSGSYPVQEPIRVVVPNTERRRLALRGEGVALVA
jgi:hypothetical protein